MPLSNPTSLAEAKPSDLYEWTKGQAIIATGSPFPDVCYEGQLFRIAQSNNALAFPGIGLGAIAAKASVLTDDMLWAATKALCQCSPIHQDKLAALLPKLSESKMISFKVALAVAQQARKEGVAQIAEEEDLEALLTRIMWEPRYYPYRKV